MPLPTYIYAQNKCASTEFLITFDTVKSGWSILYIEGSQVIISIQKNLSLKIDFALANSADPDEMLHYAAFHLGLHCLPKYQFWGVSCLQWVNKELCALRGKFAPLWSPKLKVAFHQFHSIGLFEENPKCKILTIILLLLLL